MPVKGLGSAAYKDEGYFVTVGTAQTITGKKTFAEDAVFGADGSRLFIPSGGTPGTYDIFVDPGMAVPGEEPTGGSGSGTWETWESEEDTDKPVGFHLVTSIIGRTFEAGAHLLQRGDGHTVRGVKERQQCLLAPAFRGQGGVSELQRDCEDADRALHPRAAQTLSTSPNCRVSPSGAAVSRQPESPRGTPARCP